ncbi:MAG: GAF domain-containing protein [Actinobacteria bacterium]|nr:MAG: GAF domain-containing protein [Actinomycetota bacterium]
MNLETGTDGIRATADSIMSAVSYEALLTTLLDVIRSVSACESAMVRVFSSRDWIPVHAHTGMSPRFLRDESLIPSVDCLCGRVARGDTDPSLFFFTRSGSFVTNDVDSLLARATDEQLGPVRGRCIAEGFKTVAAVPILHERRIVGVLHMASKQKERLAPEAVELLETLCSQIGGSLVSEGFELERQRKLLGSLTEALLPQPPEVIGGLRVGFAHRGASAPDAVGGDFYDVFELEGGAMGLIVGDFSGHGVGAAGLAARCRFLLHRLLLETADPAATLEAANEELAGSISEDKFSTAAVVVLDPAGKKASVALAGHPPPIMADRNGWARTGEVAGPPLGVSRGAAYDVEEVALSPEASLVLYTDGLTDSRNEKGQRFGPRQLAELCRSRSHLSPSELAGELCRVSDDYSARKHLPDDKLVLVARAQ